MNQNNAIPMQTEHGPFSKESLLKRQMDFLEGGYAGATMHQDEGTSLLERVACFLINFSWDQSPLPLEAALDYLQKHRREIEMLVNCAPDEVLRVVQLARCWNDTTDEVLVRFKDEL